MTKNINLLPECLVDFFLFQNECCNGKESGSGLTYEFLQGVDRETVAKIVTSKDENAVEFSRRLLHKAYLNFQKRLFSELKKCGLEFQDVVERINACDFMEKCAQPAAADRGIRAFKSYASKSALGMMRVTSVNLKAKNEVPVTIHIRDQYFNIIDSFETHSVAENVVTVNVNKCYPGNTLFITTNNSELITYLSNCKRDGGCCLSKMGYGNVNLTVDGFDGDQPVECGYGITACIEIVCDLSNVICVVKDQIALALLYQWGVELLVEAKSTGRINCFVDGSQTWFDDTIELWSDQVTGCIEADKDTLKTAIEKCDNLCTRCFDAIGYVPSTS